MRTDGGEMQQLTTDPAPEWAPVWSPDQDTLAFYAFRTGNREIFTMPSAGGAWTQITNDPAEDLGPTWSSDGKWIACFTGRNGGGILVSPAGGGPSHVLLPTRSATPKWSPKDDRLAFLERRGLSVVGADGSGLRMIVKGTVRGVPAWLPDGKSLIYVAPGEADGVAMMVRDDGTAARPLTKLSGRRGAMGYVATDGQFLYFTWEEDIGDLWVMNVEGGQ